MQDIQIIMNNKEIIITIAAIVFGTLVTRFLPFLIFPPTKKPPAYIQYLGTVLPYAVMGLLVVYCLKDAVFTSYKGLPEVISIAITIILQAWRRNSLLSIAFGTVLYMFLVQKVFI